MFRRYKAILFDLDGTLVDSGELWDRYTVGILQEEGLLRPSEVGRFLEVSKRGGDAISEYFPYLEGQEVERIYGKIRKAVLKHVDELKPIIPRRDLILILNGRPSAVVTQTGRKVAEAFLKAVGIEDLFDVLVTSDIVKNVKPHPEPVIRAVTELGSFPAAFIGDTEADEMAATAAGLDFYHVKAVKRYVQGAHL